MNTATEKVRILHSRRQGRTHIAVPIDTYEELVEAAERFGKVPKIKGAKQ